MAKSCSGTPMVDGTLVERLEERLFENNWRRELLEEERALADAPPDVYFTEDEPEIDEEYTSPSNAYEAHTWTRAIAWSPDGCKFATESDNNAIRLWHADSSLQCTLVGHSGRVTSLAWSHDGQMLASASEDKTIRLWNSEGTLCSVLEGHLDSVTKVAWNSENSLLASASRDRTVRLWDKQHNRSCYTLNCSVVSIAWSPDGQTLALASINGTIRLWGIQHW
jgi:WD40 repeat protein